MIHSHSVPFATTLAALEHMAAAARKAHRAICFCFRLVKLCIAPRPVPQPRIRLNELNFVAKHFTAIFQRLKESLGQAWEFALETPFIVVQKLTLDFMVLRNTVRLTQVFSPQLSSALEGPHLTGSSISLFVLELRAIRLQLCSSI
jgi:hypothetical protein